MPRTARKLRLGVIGTGSFARTCHIPGLQSHPDAIVVAVCGRGYESARAVADGFGISDVHTDVDELCHRGDIDAVTIATPNASHAAIALSALAAGKHVLCEKPLAMNPAEAHAMLNAAERSGLVHMVAFTFRYGSAVQALKQRVAAGEVGAPYYVRVQYDGWEGLDSRRTPGWRDRPELAGGGLLYDRGSHLFDMVRYILGPLEVIGGFVHHLPRLRSGAGGDEAMAVATDDMAAAWFRHANGVRGQWFTSRISPRFAENNWLEVIGPQGALRAALSRGTADSLQSSRPEAEAWQTLPLPAAAADGQPHNLGRMMRSFVDACLRGAPDPALDATFHDGVAVQEALDAVLRFDRGAVDLLLPHAR